MFLNLSSISLGLLDASVPTADVVVSGPEARTHMSVAFSYPVRGKYRVLLERYAHFGTPKNTSKHLEKWLGRPA